MLIAQMIATHELAMTFARRLKHIENIPQQDSAVNGLTKLTRTYAAQLEALKRYRSGGEQKMTVQHVHVPGSEEYSAEGGGPADLARRAGRSSAPRVSIRHEGETDVINAGRSACSERRCDGRAGNLPSELCQLVPKPDHWRGETWRRGERKQRLSRKTEPGSRPSERPGRPGDGAFPALRGGLTGESRAWGLITLPAGAPACPGANKRPPRFPRAALRSRQIWCSLSRSFASEAAQWRSRAARISESSTPNLLDHRCRC
jgi:hypothetical protein